MPVREPIRRPLLSQTCGRFLRLPENRAARLACHRLAGALVMNRRQPASLIFMHGPPGTGKSHLAQVLIDRIADERRDRAIRIVPARDLGKLAAGQTFDEANPICRYRQADLLVVEDMQHLPSTVAAAMGGLLDHRRSRHRPTLITACVGPMALQGLPSRLTNRLACGLSVRLKALTLPSLRQLARFWCSERSLRLDAEVAAWLLTRSQTGVRALFGNLARLHQLSHDYALPLDLDSAKRLLQEDALPNGSPLVAIASAVAAWFHLTPEELRLRDRRPALLWPRQVAHYVARRTTRLSLAAIGSYFGNCDHTTVLHALRKVEERIARDSGFAAELTELMS